MEPTQQPGSKKLSTASGPSREVTLIVRDRFKGRPHYAYTAQFVKKYDNPAFDPDAETYPIETFEPMVRRLFAAPKRSLYMANE